MAQLTSDIRGPGFESNRRQILLRIYDKEKEAGNCPFNKTHFAILILIDYFSPFGELHQGKLAQWHTKLAIVGQKIPFSK